MTQDQAHTILQTAKDPGFTVGKLIEKINDPALKDEVELKGDPRYDLYLDAIVMLISDRDLKKDYLEARFASGANERTLEQNTSNVMGMGKKDDVRSLWEEWCRTEKFSITKDTIVRNLIQEAVNFSYYQTNRSKSDPGSRFLTYCEDEFGMRPTISLPAASSNFPSDVAQKKIAKAIENSVERKKCIVFTGAPGTGKTYCVEEYVKDVTGQDGKNGDPHPNWEFVQFHSSYDYTDFVEGLRPIKREVEENGKKVVKMTFERVDGIFKAFCRRAAGKKENFYFIIDEINRADLGRVFGELMYCFEKRGEEHKIAMQYANLPTYDKDGGLIKDDCFQNGFYIPENVVIIGTMNDIDRSVETFDFALRRRFDWEEIEADAVMESTLIAMMEKRFEREEGRKPSDKEKKDLSDFVSKSGILPKIKAKEKVDKGEKDGLNGIIEKWPGLGREFKIGPAYFKDYDGDNLDHIWTHNIKPILREYIRGRQDPVDFINKCRDALGVSEETEGDPQ